MRTRNYIFVGVILIVVLAVYLIFATLPPKISNSGPSSAPPTPQRDSTDHLSGGQLDGQLLFSRAGYLWVWHNSIGTRLAIYPGQSIVADNQVELLQPAWSPKQSEIAYIRQDESFSDLWVVKANGSNPHSLTSDKGDGAPRSDTFTNNALWAFSPTWSPDGSQLAYLSDIKTNDLALWVVPAGGGQAQRLSTLGTGEGGMQHISWSPDGSQIAVSAFSNGKSQIYLVNASSGKTTQLTNASDGALDPAFSPDGKYVAYTQIKGNGSELWLVSVSDGNTIFLAPGPTRDPAWSPDGKKIAYLGLHGAGFDIYEVGVKTGAQIGSDGSPQQISTNANIDAAGGLSWGS